MFVYITTHATTKSMVKTTDETAKTISGTLI